MGRKKENLVPIVFRLPAPERKALEEILINAGFAVTHNKKEGQVILPDWRRWAEAIAKKEILMCTLIGNKVDTPE